MSTDPKDDLVANATPKDLAAAMYALADAMDIVGQAVSLSNRVVELAKTGQPATDAHRVVAELLLADVQKLMTKMGLGSVSTLEGDSRLRLNTPGGSVPG